MKTIKTQILGMDGNAARQIELPEFFSEPVRKDIIFKVYLAGLYKQPYAPYLFAGMQHSASGKLKHIRHKWKTLYGYGISRVPRKVHTRRGSRFMWVGATISSTVGGREAHPPKKESMVNYRKINKKEQFKAMVSALAATASQEQVAKRYSRIENVKINLPLVLDSAVTGLKVKELSRLLENVLGENFSVALREKSVRAGKGKARGRKYKSTRGLLIVLASDEKIKCKEFENVRANNVSLEQLAPAGVPGRLVAYTEKAIAELASKYGVKK